MSLLPAAMQDRQPLMQLGAKVTKPEPEKVDPVKAFEKGNHLRDGMVEQNIRTSIWLVVWGGFTSTNPILAGIPFKPPARKG